jgi:phosphoglycerate dehydrogenase-like enzyme
MDPTTFLVDMARGAALNGKALVNAIREEAIAAAAFDVYEQKPPHPDSPLHEPSLFQRSPSYGFIFHCEVV